MKKFSKTTIVASIVAGVVSSPQTALAQASTLLEEVVVTAQKKGFGESAQDVPISISAFTGDQVEALFATNLTDIGIVTPNANLVDIATFPGVANFVIRGMGTVGQSIPSSDPAVGVSIDGVSLGTIYGVVTDLFDLESIEILRGPQGTLLGRNVTGGAVTLRTSRPTEEFVGKVRLGAGNFGKADASLLLSGPLNDNWGAKIAILDKSRDEIFEAFNIEGGRTGASETTLIRPAVSYKTDSFDATLIYENGSIEADGLSSVNFAVGGVPTLDPSGVAIDPFQRRVSSQGLRGFSDLEWDQLTLETNFDLYGGKFTGTLGFRDLEQTGNSDVDGGIERRIHFLNTGLEQDQSSLELRWSGNVTDNITLTTGVYLFDQEYSYNERRVIDVANLDSRGSSTIEHDTQGIFAQADIVINDSLSAIVGGRFTQEEKSARIGVIGDPLGTNSCANQTPIQADTGVAVNFGDCRAVLTDTEDWSNFTPKLGLNWSISDDILAFASYTRGFRSGGYNVRFTDSTFVTNPASPNSQPGPYDEESVDAFEVGLKSTFAGGRVRFNASLFNNEFEDLQRTTLGPGGGQEIQNAADATIRGLEFDATIGVTNNLILQAGLGYVDASYGSFPGIEASAAANGFDVGELQLVLAPELTYNLAATYDWSLNEYSFISARVSFAYTDGTASTDSNSVVTEDYDFIDASITYKNDNGLTISAYGKNVTDEVFYDFGVNIVGSESFFATPPRTYGVELTYEF